MPKNGKKYSFTSLLSGASSKNNVFCVGFHLVNINELNAQVTDFGRAES